jgi:hypothetical protein
MASTAPGSWSRAISALTALPITASRSEDMPTSSGLPRGNGSAAWAVNGMLMIPATIPARMKVDYARALLIVSLPAYPG